jgi:hypothetical protein
MAVNYYPVEYSRESNRYYRREEEGYRVLLTCKTDTTPAHSIYREYNSRCNSCWLNHGHSQASHQQQIA